MQDKCHKCGHSLPVRLLKNGPHVEAVCSFCQKHISFIKKASIPSWVTSKERIWNLTKGNLQLIEEKKKVFPKIGQKDLQDLEYHNLYACLVKHFYTELNLHMNLLNELIVTQTAR